MTPDEQLVKLALAGDDKAFGQLVDRYQERLLRFLEVRCRERADAEDALQDAFVDAWRHLATYDERWRFSTWLYRIAINRAGRIAKRRLRGQDGQATGVADGEDPLAACIAGEERENLWVLARRHLGEEAVTALWLHYVEGLPQREVARSLDRSLPWTKVTLMRARKRLKAAADETAGRAKRQAYG